MTDDSSPPHWAWLLAVLTVAVLAISSSSVLVKLAPGVHPLVIGLWRTLGVALLLAPSIRRTSRRDGLIILLAGLCLAGHFWSWFASLRHTTVLRSTVLVALNPIWIGLLEWLVLRDPPNRKYWAGVGLAIGGVLLMGLTEQQHAAAATNQDAWLGDGLALLGGIFGSLYLFAGRSARQRVGIGTYGSLVCFAAALFLLPAALLAQAPLVGFPTSVLLVLLAIICGPQLLGHNGINYAVRFLPASVVSTAILLEPVGASCFALVVLGEMPQHQEMVGGLIVLAGVMLANVGVSLTPSTGDVSPTI